MPINPRLHGKTGGGARKSRRKQFHSCLPTARTRKTKRLSRTREKVKSYTPACPLTSAHDINTFIKYIRSDSGSQAASAKRGSALSHGLLSVGWDRIPCQITVSHSLPLVLSFLSLPAVAGCTPTLREHFPATKACHRGCLLCSPKCPCETEGARNIGSIFKDEQIDLSVLFKLQQGLMGEEEVGKDKRPSFRRTIWEFVLES